MSSQLVHKQVKLRKIVFQLLQTLLEEFLEEDTRQVFKLMLA